MLFSIPSEESGPRAPAQRCVAIANTHAGSRSDEELGHRLAVLLGRAGFTGKLQLVPSAELETTLGKLPHEPTLVLVAGGDGTVRTAARVLARTPHTLGVLPLGTINVFARTLGIPLDLERAVDALAQGVDRTVDLGEVNGEIFVTNCTLGVYADLARRRERQRWRYGHLPKLVRWTVGTTSALAGVLSSWRVLRVHIEGDDRWQKVPLVIVSTNDYRDGIAFRRLEGHCLAVYTPRRVGRLALAVLFVKALVHGPDRVDDLQVEITHDIEIRTRRRALLVMDGEVQRMDSPLRFRCVPDALRARTPNGA